MQAELETAQKTIIELQNQLMELDKVSVLSIFTRLIIILWTPWQVKNELSHREVELQALTTQLASERMSEEERHHLLNERVQLEAEVHQLRTQVVQKEHETDKLKQEMERQKKG